MTRKRAPTQAEFPYHCTGRCINRDWFSLPMEEVWQIMSNQLYFLNIAYGAEIHAFVLMPNHFHLIIRTPQNNLSQAMGTFMRETSRAITKSANRINQTYGQRHFRGVLQSHHYYLHAYKYLYRNPLEANLCERAELYPFSTLHGLLGFRHMMIPVTEDVTLFSNVEATLEWLNRAPTTAAWESVRNALKKPKFKLPKDPHTKRPCILEHDAL